MHLNFAIGCDGHIAACDGKPAAISCGEDWRRVHELRERYDAIAVGAQTWIGDRPLLTARREHLGREPRQQPARVIFIGRRACPVAANGRRTFVVGAVAPGLPDAHPDICFIPAEDRDLRSPLAALHEAGLGSLLVEGGPTLLRSFLVQGLFDIVEVYVRNPCPDESRRFAYRILDALPLSSSARALGEGTLLTFGAKPPGRQPSIGDQKMPSNAATLAPESAATITETFDRHRGPVTCVAHIPGTNKAVSSCYDSAVALVDFDRKTMELLGYHDHLVNRVAINAAGTKAASCSSDYTVVLWDLERRAPERVLRGHMDDVEDFAFVDDQTGVSVSRDHRVILWNLGNGAIRRIIDEHQKDVLSVVCSDGKIYTSGDDMTLRQWDLATGKMLRMWGPFEQETDTCAIDPLHGRAVLGADDGCIRIFDIASGALVHEIEAHASGIKKVAVSPANGDILSAAYDQKLLIWDAGTFALKVSLHRTPSVWERSLNWSADGRHVMAGTFDGTALLWDAADGRVLCEVGNQEKTRGNACLNEVSMNAAGDLVMVSDDGYVRRGRITPTESRWLDTVEPVAGRILMNGITLDDRHGLVAAGAHDHKLHIWKRRADGGLGEEIELALGEGPINCIRIAHNPGFDGDAFVACYSSAIVRVSPRGEVRDTIRVHEGAVKALRIHPEKPIGVSCGADNLLLSWNLGGGLRKRYQGHMAIVDDVDIDPSGTKIASVSRDFTVKVYDLESAEMLHSIAIGHRSPKSTCFWDPSTVLIGDYWGALLKVDLEEGKVTWHPIARNGLSSLARSGDYLAATSYDGSLYLVRPSDMAVVSTLRAMRQRLVEESVV